MGSDTRSSTPELKGITLRRANRADLADVVVLERACYADPWPASAFASLPDNSRVFFTIARDVAGRIVGYVVAWYVMDEGELANLAVAPEHRRFGVGKCLLDAVLADATARGVTDLYLEVRESNTAARRLYAARGFVETDRRQEYYRNPVEDALILRRSLTP